MLIVFIYPCERIFDRTVGLIFFFRNLPISFYLFLCLSKFIVLFSLFLFIMLHIFVFFCVL